MKIFYFLMFKYLKKLLQNYRRFIFNKYFLIKYLINIFNYLLII